MIMQEKHKELLTILARGADINTTYRACGIGRATFYRWREKDPEFRSQLEALLTAQQDLGTSIPPHTPKLGHESETLQLHVLDRLETGEAFREDTEPVLVGQSMNAVGVGNAQGFVYWRKCKPEPAMPEPPIDWVRW